MKLSRSRGLLELALILLFLTNSAAEAGALKRLPHLDRALNGRAFAARSRSAGLEAVALPLGQVRYWAYQIQGLDLPGAVSAVAQSGYDMIVLEPMRTDWSSTQTRQFDTRSLVEQMKNSHANDGVHRKLVFAYINIGQAEDWRWYWTWSKEWPLGTPVPADWPRFIVTRDPDGWSGNYPVAYWRPEWKDIVIHGSRSAPQADRDYVSIVDETIRDGFDGIYLDWVEAFQDPDVVARAAAEGIDPMTAMVQFIAEMRAYARARKPGFLIIQQNGAGLLAERRDLAQAVDGIAKEHIWWQGDADVSWDNPAGFDLPIEADLSRKFIDELQEYLRIGLPVFNVEYTVAHADQSYRDSRALGFTPYCSRSSLIRLSSTPPPAELRWLRAPGPRPRFEIRGFPTQIYRIERSVDLRTWKQIGSRQSEGGIMLFEDTEDSMALRGFYRVVAP